jgi:hypothetical protein
MDHFAACVLALLAAVILSACVGGRSGRVVSDARETLARNREAIDRLQYGMSEEAAGAVMGRTPMKPPWANVWNIGPQSVANPFDALEFVSPNGDAYVVQRYALELHGDPNCPFVRGEATFVPLIFLDTTLVGWRWSYLESALQRPLTAEEREFRFGGFCGGGDESRNQPGSAAPRSDNGGPSASNPDPRQ